MGPGLYIHVPFCARKCAYCAFFSRMAEPGATEAWLGGVARELAELPTDFVPETVFIGGGTPTELTESALARLLELIHARVRLSAVTEWTCEANPGTLTAAKAARLRGAGVNRLSIGAQSFDDATLRRLGRIHDAAAIPAAVELARAAGFENLSLDLIYGVPDTSSATFRASLAEAMALGPEHISCYCLEVEPDTPFARWAAAERVEIDEEEQREQFYAARRELSAAGWNHYEISNFARPGRECRHNLLYWSGGEYMGVGPAAHSHWRGRRWGNTAELPEWRREFTEELEPEAKARETLVMGLRRIRGWGRGEFRERTGYDYEALRGAEIARAAEAGGRVVTPERVRLADGAVFVSNSVLAELV